MNKAIIFVDTKSDDIMVNPISFLKVGGISLLERQLRQLKILGFEHVFLLSFTMPEKLHLYVPKLKRVPQNIKVVDANFIDTSFWDGFENCLILEEGCLIDDRILEHVLTGTNKNIIAAFAQDDVIYGKNKATMIEFNGKKKIFASAALVERQVLKAASLNESFNKKPIKNILSQALQSPDCAFMLVSQIEPYMSNRRRDVPLLWRPITEASECAMGTEALIEMAQKGTLDWPARWIHPFFENSLVRLLIITFLTPNMITVLTGVLGFFITYLFAIGQMGPAIGGAMIIGVLDGVDGKLARVKMLATKLGDLEHILDKVVEYSWYLAMAYYFAQETQTSWPWAIGWAISLFAWAEVVQGEFFRRLTGRQLDDTGVFERTFRIIGARRNTLIWAFIPFVLTQKWEEGFWLMAIYSAVTFFVAQWRFIVRTRDYTMAVSDEITENINKTRYF